MKCPECGKEMREGYLFCSKDGAFSFANEVPGVFEMSAKKGEVWKLGIKGTTAAVTWSIDGDSSGVCTLDGDKLTVTGTTSGRYATVVGSVGGGTVKAIIRIR